jgi:hypothetical protein
VGAVFAAKRSIARSLTSRALIALLRIGNEPIPSGFVMPTPLGEAAQTRNPVLSDLCREHRAKPVPPKSDSLMADIDPALGQQILNVAQRQQVPHVHHYDQTDHFWRAVEISERVAHSLTLAWPDTVSVSSDKAVWTVEIERRRRR